MVGHHCRNCDTMLHQSWRFCPNCGQRGDAARLSFADIKREISYSFANVERSLLSFAWALLIRPGQVAHEYVQGKRKRYYGPFATLFVLVGVTALAVNALDYRMLAQDQLPHLHSAFMRQHVNHVLLAQLPVMGVVCAVLFRSAGLLLPEHMVMVAYSLTVRAAFVALVAPLSWLASNAAPSAYTVYAFWLGWYVYFGWVASQFYEGSRVWSWIRGVAAAAIGHGIIVFLLMTGSAAYDLLLVR
jgi:hypothetical protein